MKVCIFSHFSITNRAGASLSMFEIIDEMIARNIDVVLVISNLNNIDYKKFNGKVKFIVFPFYSMRISLFNKSYISRIKFFIKFIINFMKGLSLQRVIRKEKVDLIYINGLDNSMAAEIANRLHLPYVWHVRQLLEEDFSVRLFLKNYIYKLLFRASCVIAISKEVKSKYESIIGREVDLIYNGVPIDKYKINTINKFSDPVVKLLLVGRISLEKGQFDAVKAIEILKSRGVHNVQLIIVGQSESKEYLEKLKLYIINHNLSDRICILDHRDNLGDLRRQCDIGLICSKKEAFGRVTIENMLAGMLVIGANTGGTSEIVRDGYNGLLYQEGCPSSLAECIEYSIFNKNEMSKIITAGMSCSEVNYSIKRVVDQILTLFVKKCGIKNLL